MSNSLWIILTKDQVDWLVECYSSENSIPIISEQVFGRNNGVGEFLELVGGLKTMMMTSWVMTHAMHIRFGPEPAMFPIAAWSSLNIYLINLACKG